MRSESLEERFIVGWLDMKRLARQALRGSQVVVAPENWKNWMKVNSARLFCGQRRRLDMKRTCGPFVGCIV
jgi:hypothetical protein